MLRFWRKEKRTNSQAVIANYQGLILLSLFHEKKAKTGLYFSITYREVHACMCTKLLSMNEVNF